MASCSKPARLPGALLAGALAALAGAAAGVSAADLTGEWVLNGALSQPSPLPPPRPNAQQDAVRQVLQAIPPEDSVLPDPIVEIDPATGRPMPVRRRPPSWLFRPERVEAFRELIGETRELTIVQTATYVDLRHGQGSRSLEVGAESQVSLPTGELADQRVQWRGDRLVVERRVPRGARLVETYRLLPETGQLELTLRRSGGGSPKLEWRRVFDRDDGSAAPAAEAPGPAGTAPGTAPGTAGTVPR
jgi:hypothetical protein